MCRKSICLVSLAVLLGLACCASAEIPKDPNLVIFYSYDSVGLIVPDESGKGHNGTVAGDVSLVDSGIKWYGAAQFEGIWGPTGYSYLDLDSPSYPDEDIPKTAITLAAWCKCRDTGQHHALMSTRAADNTWVMHPQVNSDRTFRWLLRTYGGTTIFNLNGVGSHGWDEWLHYAGTYDSTTGKGILYINGEVCAQIDVPVGQLIADWGTGARVGYNIDNARPFTGVMDEFYLFTRALTQDEVNVLLEAEGLLSEKATHPNPADGTELEDTATVLQWLPGAYAVSNDVYFGQSFQDVNDGNGDTFKGNQTAAEFAVTDLQWGTTYYWRIDGVNTVEPNSPWKGDVWSFLLRPTTAWDPTPADGAQWIDPNTDLSWSAGRGAGTHDVYFGDDFDAVNDATDAMSQAETTYDPGLLEYEKTYYWRVDEVDESGTLQKGEVWSFTTARADSGIRGEYYSDTEFGTLVLSRVDPGINFNWGTESPDSDVPADNFSVRWTGELEVPFTASWTFTVNCDDGVRLWVNGELLFDRWNEQSGVEWIGTADLVEGQKYSIQMEYYEGSGNAEAVLYWNSPSWLSPYQPKQPIPQGAFSLPIKARSPRPANNAVDVPQTSTTLSWSSGEAAVSHNVYFGTDPNAVKDADTGSPEYKGNRELGSESYDPGELEWNTTYYWRVDEVEDDGAIRTGSPWNFTTADFLVVEDFEAYDDDVEGGTTIFQTWIDGEGNGTTSYVGHQIADNGTFGETTVVHGGSQSMPLRYFNSDEPYYAQTDRTWDTEQDWTLNGIDTLVLHVQGVSTNAPEPLYVAVEDGSGNIHTVTQSDPTVITTAEWTEWRILLSEFTSAGVDMTRVMALHIGVGSEIDPVPDGIGLVYVDDILVLKGQ